MWTGIICAHKTLFLMPGYKYGLNYVAIHRLYLHYVTILLHSYVSIINYIIIIIVINIGKAGQVYVHIGH